MYTYKLRIVVSKIVLLAMSSLVCMFYAKAEEEEPNEGFNSELITLANMIKYGRSAIKSHLSATAPDPSLYNNDLKMDLDPAQIDVNVDPTQFLITILSLPLELVYEIFDYLDIEALSNLAYSSKGLNKKVREYQYYKTELKAIRIIKLITASNTHDILNANDQEELLLQEWIQLLQNVDNFNIWDRLIDNFLNNYYTLRDLEYLEPYAIDNRFPLISQWYLKVKELWWVPATKLTKLNQGPNNSPEEERLLQEEWMQLLQNLNNSRLGRIVDNFLTNNYTYEDFTELAIYAHKKFPLIHNWCINSLTPRAE